MTNLISIAAVVLRLTNFVEQIEPHPTNQAYYTNYGTNLLASGTLTRTGYVGPCAKLSWARTSTRMAIQSSASVFGPWTDVRVIFAGPTAPTNWLVLPVEAVRFYRLKGLP